VSRQIVMLRSTALVLACSFLAATGVVSRESAVARAASGIAKRMGHPARTYPHRHYGGLTKSLGIHGTPTIGELRHRAAASSTGPLNSAATAVNLHNYGGPVMTNVVIYNIYWVPTGAQAPNEALINRFTGDLGGPLVGLLSQYGVQNQTNFGGSWVDTSEIPSGPSINGRHILQDSDVQAAIVDAQNANPQWQPPGLSTLYMVYLPLGTELCHSGVGCTFGPNKSGPNGSAGEVFCAYHGAYTEESSPEPGSPIVYGAMPFDGDRMAGCGATSTVTTGYNGSSGPNGDPANDSEISTASHEIFESLTDPEVTQNAAWTGGQNPIDPNFPRNGEIGDLCAYLYQPASDGGDVTLNGNRYFLQYEWSNATSSCILANGAILPTSSSAGCTANTLLANDDGSTEAVTLPFLVNYFGTTYEEAWVNNNGNITFNGPLSTYTPFSLLSTNTPIIAPYFSDVDTRGQLPVPSGLMTYGSTTFGGHAAFCVDWRGVGYFAAHTDKLSSFQLLLVQRSDIAPGDFDIIFNYDRIQWETGDASGGIGGFGGGSARAGFSNGSTNSLELVGSGINGALLDSGVDALSAGSHASTQPGRYVFAVRNGSNAGGATISGEVTDTSSPANPVAGALVQACGGFLSTVVCDLATTNASGNYSITSLPAGIYNVTVSPPVGSPLEQQSTPAILLPNASLTENFALNGPTPPPSGTEFGGVGYTTTGVPVVNWQSSSPLTTHGCVGGAATASVTAENSTNGEQQTIAAVLTESPGGSGTYTGSIPALYPLHGSGVVDISITCPNASQDANFNFTIYIDPSGTVVNTEGEALSGATVTLLRSEDPSGPFTAVEAGSAIMSPGNRANPSVTGGDGSFGWDVLTGYYVIRAEKTGCTDPQNAALDHVESSVLTIPPPVANLVLTLHCSSPLAITSEAATAFSVGQPGSFTVSTNADEALALTEEGSLPAGVTFVDDHDGTGRLTGTPQSGTVKAYNFTIHAATQATSTDQQFTLTVTRAATAIALVVNPATSLRGSTTTAIATVTTDPLNTLTPTGVVSFILDSASTPLAAAPLSGNQATVVVPATAVGSHTITASYAGDIDFSASSSPSSTFEVTIPSNILDRLPSLEGGVLGSKSEALPPVLSGLTVAPRAFRPASAGGTVARATTGATISYRDSQNATSTFMIQRSEVGSAYGHQCKPAAHRRHKHKRGKSCIRYVLVARFSHADLAGAVKLHFTGRAHGKRLVAGRYRLVASGHNSSGLTSNAVSTSFAVLA
jgi:hypothetical protein